MEQFWTRFSKEVTPSAIESYLYTVGLPDLDLIVRTSGEVRSSGFLLWQSAASEFGLLRHKLARVPQGRFCALCDRFSSVRDASDVEASRQRPLYELRAPNFRIRVRRLRATIAIQPIVAWTPKRSFRPRGGSTDVGRRADDAMRATRVPEFAKPLPFAR